MAKDELSSVESSDRLPAGLELSPLDEEFRRCPYPILDRLRRESPVYRDPAFDRVFLTRYADARAVSTDDAHFVVDPRKSREGAYARLTLDRGTGDRFEQTLTRIDDPDHRRLRSLVMRAFTPKAMAAITPRIKSLSEELLDALKGRDSFDFIDTFASPLPCLVIADMLGVDPSEQRNFKLWSEARQYQNHPARTPEQNAELEWGQSNLTNYFRRIVEERRKNRGTDLVSVLIEAEEDGNRLTSDEIVDMCKLLLSAGNVTTTDLLGNGLVALLQNPEQMSKLRANPSLIQNTIEEILRYDSPIALSNRITACPHEVGGVPLETGESVTISVFAANHDPAVHDRPDVFDIERKNTTHIAFGGGAHFCLGSPLARAEAQIAIPMILERFPTLSLDPDKPLARKPSANFNGWAQVWMKTSG